MSREFPIWTLGCAAIAARAVTCALATVAVLTTAAEPALAGPSDNETKAFEIYQRAKALFEAKDYEKSADLAEQAERLFAQPMIVLLKGRAMRQLGRLREADAAFKQCKAGAAQLSKQALHILTDEIIANADEMRSKGELIIAVEGSTAAQVLVDGAEVRMPYARWLPVGKHRVEALAAGRKSVRRDVEITAASTAEVKLNLDIRDGRLVVVAPGSLRNVVVRIDGKVVEIADEARIGDRSPPQTVEPGSHEVVCVRGERQVGSRVEVPADGVVDARCDGLDPPPSPARRAAGWGGVALGGSLFAFGAYNVGYYAYKTSNGFVERVPEGSVSRMSGGLTYALVGAAVGTASWLLWLRDGGAATADAHPLASPPRPTAIAAARD